MLVYVTCYFVADAKCSGIDRKKSGDIQHSSTSYVIRPSTTEMTTNDLQGDVAYGSTTHSSFDNVSLEDRN